MKSNHRVPPHSNLSFANLEEAELSFANLNNTILIGAKLGKANLHLADLSGADLTEAIITTEQLSQVKSLKSANIAENFQKIPEIARLL